MTQAIHTRYLPPTNTLPSRIVATAQAGRVVVDYDHGLEQDENHQAAAAEALRAFGWTYGPWATGCMPDGSYVHTLANDKRFSPSDYKPAED